MIKRILRPKDQEFYGDIKLMVLDVEVDLSIKVNFEEEAGIEECATSFHCNELDFSKATEEEKMLIYRKARKALDKKLKEVLGTGC